MADAAVSKSLTLSVEQKGGSTVVHCHGRLVAEVADSFYAHVQPLIREHKCVVLDLTDLTRMDSMGLGSLVRLYVSAKGAGSRIELVNLGKQIRELLGMTHLLDVFSGLCEQGIVMKF